MKLFSLNLLWLPSCFPLRQSTSALFFPFPFFFFPWPNSGCMLGAATCSFINTEPGALWELPARPLSALYGSRDGGLATVYRSTRVCACVRARVCLPCAGQQGQIIIFLGRSVELLGQTIHRPAFRDCARTCVFLSWRACGSRGIASLTLPPGSRVWKGGLSLQRASGLAAAAAAASPPRGESLFMRQG